MRASLFVVLGSLKERKRKKEETRREEHGTPSTDPNSALICQWKGNACCNGTCSCNDDARDIFKCLLELMALDDMVCSAVSVYKMSCQGPLDLQSL